MSNRWIFCVLSFIVLLYLALPSILLADEKEAETAIQLLIRQGKMTEAEKALRNAESKFPDAPSLGMIHLSFGLRENRADNHQAALKHFIAYFDAQMKAVAKTHHLNTFSLPKYVDTLLSLYRTVGREAEASRKLREMLAVIEKASLAESRSQIELTLCASELRIRQFLLIAANDSPEEAFDSLNRRLVAAREAVIERPTDADALLNLMMLLKAEWKLAESTDSDSLKNLRSAYLERLLKTARQHSDDPALIAAALRDHMEVVEALSRKDPYEAADRLQSIREFAETQRQKPDFRRMTHSVTSRLALLENSTRRFESMIRLGKIHVDLIGKQAIPLDDTDWVNGDSPTDKDLQGKVVLLDFWAVWCGPCIAEFPHLRRWHDEYAEKGLVIIGVSKYYQYDWDVVTQKGQLAEGLSQEKERAVVVKFAKHHKLRQRLAIARPSSSIHEQYGVSGIPQFVLIDRQGKIQMIKRGGGDTHIREIGSRIAELIGDAE